MLEIAEKEAMAASDWAVWVLCDLRSEHALPHHFARASVCFRLGKGKQGWRGLGGCVFLRETLSTTRLLHEPLPEDIVLYILSRDATNGPTADHCGRVRADGQTKSDSPRKARAVYHLVPCVARRRHLSARIAGANGFHRPVL